MTKSLTIAPIVAGKERRLQEVAQYFRDHRADHEASRQRAGVTMERAYAMETPQGSILVAYLETMDGPAKAFQTLATSDLPFDRWFFDLLKDLHGIDFRQAPPGPPPERFFDWVDPDVRVRKRGLAFASPVVPGKTEQGRAFAAEAFGRRGAELAASRRRIGGTHEFGELHHTPMGDVFGVYLEGNDPKVENAAFARSTDPYDVWFKKEAGEVLGQDFNKPLPPIQEIVDFQQPTVRA